MALDISLGSLNHHLVFQMALCTIMGDAFLNNGTKIHSNSTFSAIFLKRFRKNEMNFITIDENWAYHYDPELKTRG